MSKTMRAATFFQILYCIGCCVVLICMPLYTAFYTTDFGIICFRIGAVMNLVSFLNPVGAICAVVNLVSFLSTCRESDTKPSVKVLLWVIIGPLLTMLLWYLSVSSFVYHSGGV